jgi:hypothetical protein
MHRRCLFVRRLHNVQRRTRSVAIAQRTELSRAFGGRFYFCQFFGSQSRGCGLGAEAGPPRHWRTSRTAASNLRRAGIAESVIMKIGVGRPADAAELVLAELWAVRYALLNLFHAAADAVSEGGQPSPDSVLKIRDQADARKLHQVRRLLEEFFAREG